MASFLGQATLSYGECRANSNYTAGEVVGALSVEKMALCSTYSCGQSLFFVLQLINRSSETLSSVCITDDLGTYTDSGMLLTPLSYVEGSALLYREERISPVSASAGEASITLQGFSLPPHCTALLLYEVCVNAAAPMEAGATIKSTSTASACGLIEPVSASSTVCAAACPQLVLFKSLSPKTISPGEKLTYTFVIQNIGAAPTSPEENLTISDVFDPVLSDIEVYYNDTPWQIGTSFTYNAKSGLFTTLPNAIFVPAASFVRSHTTGASAMTPGVATIRITGTV